MIKINWLQIILIIALAVSVITAIVFINKYAKEHSEHLDTKTELDVTRDTLKTSRDANGVMYGTISEYSKNNKELKHTRDSFEIKMLEQARLNKIKDYQIAKLQYALIESKDSLNSVIHDTTVIIKGIKYDKYANFDNGFLVADIYIQSDSTCAELDYKYTTEIYMTDYWDKRKFFLWRWLGIRGKHQKFDFKSADPNTNIKVLRSVSVN